MCSFLSLIILTKISIVESQRAEIITAWSLPPLCLFTTVRYGSYNILVMIKGRNEL